MVVSLRTSNSRLPLGVTTVATSPTCLPMSERPMGEVVEMRPWLTSDSSDVTSLYSISSSLVESKTRTVEPKAMRSWGMLERLNERELRHALLELTEARVDELLALFRHMVFGIFTEVAERSCLLDLLRQFVRELMLHLPDLFF